MQIQIKDNHGNGIGDANIRLAVGHGDSDAAIFDFKSNSDGTQSWPIPFWPVMDYTLHVNYREVLPAYAATSVYVPKPVDGAYQDVQIVLETVAQTPTLLPRVRVDGDIFRDSNGKEVVFRGVSFFAAYDTYLRGGLDSLRTALTELRTLGCNAVRVFGMSKYVQENLLGRPAFKPQDWGEAYYDKLPEFCDFCASYGMYIYWSIFPDNGYIMPDQNEQVTHFNRMMGKLNERNNNLVELTNEPNAHGFNAVDVTKFAKPNGIPSNSGSYGDDYGGSLPPWPVWDFGDLHSNRSYPKQIKDNCTLDHPIYTILHRPVIVGEPDRFGSNGNGNIRQAVSAAAGALASPGYFFHSIQGEKAEPFDEQTRNCAVPAFQALTAVKI